MNKSTFISLEPRISEKTYGLSEKLNTYVFKVPKTANKHEIADAVATQFKVTVTGVKTAVIKGKAKRSPRKRQQPVAGKRVDIKKAFVTLKKGDSIKIFEEGK